MPGAGGGENELFNTCTVSVTQMSKSRHLLYNVVSIVNNSVNT